jgi:hypothetical protein
MRRFVSVGRWPFPSTIFGNTIAFRCLKERITMPNKTDSPDTQKLQEDSADAQKAVQEKLDRIADKAAKRGEKREQRYDEEHGIFTR